MSCLPVFAGAKSHDVLRAQRERRGLPVQIEEARVSGLEENIRQVLPERQRRGITEQPLTDGPVSADEVASEDEIGREGVRENGDFIDDLVDDRCRERPREVARSVGGEWSPTDQIEGLTTKRQCRWFVDTLGIPDETLEAGPVSCGVDELVARPPRGGR